MTRMNDIVRSGLNRALAAVFELEDDGCTVVDVRITSATPVIAVDRPPKRVTARMYINSNGFFSPDTTCVGELHGCRVEWRQNASIHQLRERTL